MFDSDLLNLCSNPDMNQLLSPLTVVSLPVVGQITRAAGQHSNQAVKLKPEFQFSKSLAQMSQRRPLLTIVHQLQNGLLFVILITVGQRLMVP